MQSVMEALQSMAEAYTLRQIVDHRNVSTIKIMCDNLKNLFNA